MTAAQVPQVIHIPRGSLPKSDETFLDRLIRRNYGTLTVHRARKRLIIGFFQAAIIVALLLPFLSPLWVPLLIWRRNKHWNRLLPKSNPGAVVELVELTRA